MDTTSVKDLIRRGEQEIPSVHKMCDAIKVSREAFDGISAHLGAELKHQDNGYLAAEILAATVQLGVALGYFYALSQYDKLLGLEDRKRGV